MSGSARESTFDRPSCLIKYCWHPVSVESIGFCDEHLEELRQRLLEKDDEST